MSDKSLEVLRKLNTGYIRAVAEADAAWFEENLSHDFLNTNPDGTRLQRAAFIDQIRRGSAVSALEEHDVLIRLFKGYAIVHGRTKYTKPDGAAGAGWYTDDWQMEDGRWKCVAAHVSRS